MTMLSEHFSLEELTITQVRADNAPPPEVVDHLHVTARGLEQVRALLGHPININSGYRSPYVNERVGGSPTSDHPHGWCADFICPEFGTPLDICRAIVADESIIFDQLLQEGTWVHISFSPRSRMDVRTKDGSGRLVPGLHG